MKEITPKDALKLIENGSAILIDVRETEEFAESHIPYAISIPMSIIDKTFHHLTFPSTQTLIFQCKMGGRSGRVCEYVSSIPEVENEIVNMTGGITKWKEDGLVTV
jgi:rhodanese-related sulfurtransferase